MRTWRYSNVSHRALDAVPSHTGILLDANIFVYGVQGRSEQCRSLLRRCACEDVYGLTTLHVINEVTHVLMLEEARVAGIITGKQGVAVLRGKWQGVAGLHNYWKQILSLLEMNIAVLNLDIGVVRRAHEVRAQHGLLTNDSVIVAAMRDYGISALASADADFDRVSDVTRYRPSDLPSPS
jgi:predicted nucleic acid-binding protein